MEFIGALILLVLAVPVIAIVALVKAVGASDRILRLERRIGELESRLAEAIRATPARPPEEAPEQPSQRAAEPEPLPETVATPIAEQEPPTAPEPEPEPVSEPTPQTSTPASSFPAPSFEERFGTRWVVWIGGLALALGGIFLVRHTIEAGLLGAADGDLSLAQILEALASLLDADPDQIRATYLPRTRELLSDGYLEFESPGAVADNS